MTLRASGNYAIKTEGTNIYAAFEDDADAARFAAVLRPKQTTRESEWASMALARMDDAVYGRIISVCLKGTEDLNRWMVSSGWAVAYRKYSLDYATDEEHAHLAKVGIWSGTFDMPWAWRSQKQK